ncbi:hypothetical protein EVAR_61932_1 [Eumeta japonica]|uniref:Uncharacterized protein n=1 Tax=Eumeta variegata TaxID=151549 RepID=A0A4C1ZM70_EUMVA|nr:hypothetical protein EVAR_61932_1 [Eumeta japonica]
MHHSQAVQSGKVSCLVLSTVDFFKGKIFSPDDTKSIRVPYHPLYLRARNPKIVDFGKQTALGRKGNTYNRWAPVLCGDTIVIGARRPRPRPRPAPAPAQPSAVQSLITESMPDSLQWGMFRMPRTIH